MFVVVEFEESCGGGLAIVANNWLTPRKKEVFWPPYKENAQYLRALKKAEEFNTETWKIFNVSRIFYESDSYEKTYSKLKLAELSSEIQSDQEQESLRCRKRRPPRRLSFSDDELSDSKLPRPPPMTKLQQEQSVNHRIDVLRKEDLGISQSVRSSGPKPSNIQASCTFTHSSGSPSPKSQCRREPTEYSLNHRIEVLRKEDVDTSQSLGASSSKSVSSICSPQSLGTPSHKTKNIFSEHTAFQTILSQINQLKEQNKLIISLLNKQIDENVVETRLPDNLPIQLPVKNQNDFDLLEEYLQNPEHIDLLISYFSTKGGKDLTAATNRILRSVLTDAVASNFSFFGKRLDKKPFCNTATKIVVVGAVKKKSGKEDSEIEDVIKIWLKHAPQRMKSLKSKEF